MREWSQSEQNGLFFCSENQPEIQATCAIKAAIAEASKGCTGEIFSYPIASIEPVFELFNYHDCKYEKKEFIETPLPQKDFRKYSFVVPYFAAADSKQWLLGVYEALSSLTSIDELFFFEVIATNKRVHIQFASAQKHSSVIEKAFRARFPQSEFCIQKDDFLLECLSTANYDSLYIESLYPNYPYNRNLFAPIAKKSSVLHQLLQSLSVLEDGEVFYYRVGIEKSKSQWEINCLNIHTYEHKILSIYADANLIDGWRFSPYSESKKAIADKMHPENAPFFFAQPMIAYFGKRHKFDALKSFICGYRFGDSPYKTLNQSDFYEKIGKQKTIDSLKNRTMHMQGHFLNRLELSCFVLFPCECCHELKDNHLNTAIGKPIPKEFQTSGILLGNKNHAGTSTELRIPKKNLDHSLVTIGNMGFGKSNLLLNILAQLAESENPKYSIIVFYFHDFEFVSDFISRIPDSRINDVVLAMPTLEGKILKKNFVDSRGVKDLSLKASDLAYAFETGSTDFGINIMYRITNLFQILLLADNVSLADIFCVARNKSEKGRKIRMQAKERTNNPLLREYIDNLNERSEDENTILNKFQSMFNTQSTAFMSHYCGKDAIDYKDIIENKKILIWYFGGLNNAGDMIASVETSLIHHHFLSYGNVDPRPYFPTITVIDEAQRIKARGIAEAVREDRKHGLSNIFSTQTLKGVDPALIEAIDIIPNLAFFQCSEDDAKFFSQRAGGSISPKDIASFDKFEMATRLLTAKHVYSCMPEKFQKGDETKIKIVIKSSLEKYYTDFPKEPDEDIHKNIASAQIVDVLPESIKQIMNRKPSKKRS